jgi:hypothetical protein
VVLSLLSEKPGRMNLAKDENILPKRVDRVLHIRCMIYAQAVESKQACFGSSFA